MAPVTWQENKSKQSDTKSDSPGTTGKKPVDGTAPPSGQNPREILDRYLPTRPDAKTRWLVGLGVALGLGGAFFLHNRNPASSALMNPEDFEYIRVQPMPPQVDPESEPESEDGKIKEGDKPKAPSIEQTAVDLAFNPDIKKPVPAAPFKKIFPDEAVELETEATVTAEIFINDSGKIELVKIIAVQLSKPLPAQTAANLKNKFRSAAQKIWALAKFKPAEQKGKPIPVRMVEKLVFTLPN